MTLQTLEPRLNMLFLDHIRFHWPLLMMLAFLLVGGDRIKAKFEFFIFGALVLYGISRLASGDVLPSLIGLLPNSVGLPNINFEMLHWIFQAGAAMCGVFALVRLNKALTPST